MRRSVLNYMVITAVFFCLVACEGNGSDDARIEENNRINEWILENMQLYYLWEKQIPKKTNMDLAPAEYFKSILYKAEDRFSWIEEDYTDLMNSLVGVSKEAGYDFTLDLYDEAKKTVAGLITYVKKGSPAEKAGLKRGQIFLRINGKTMTANNYSDVLNSEIRDAHTLTIWNPKDQTSKDVKLDVVENFAENPIFLDTVYQTANHKVGYLIYNFFASDPGSGDMCYDKQMNDIFGDFINENIDVLIIDLRYNLGGSEITCVNLGSMISNEGKSSLFMHAYYNDGFTEYLEYSGINTDRMFADSIYTYFENSKVPELTAINHLNIKKLYCIVTGNTASASEVLINSLNPYLGDDNVILVGDVTYGKNVGSITIYEDDPVKQKTNKWGLQPIVVKVANSIGFGDYGKGFTPDIEADELKRWKIDIFDDGTVLRPLGDTREVMLQRTLNAIEGLVTARANVSSTPEIRGFTLDRYKARNSLILDRKRVPKKQMLVP